MELASGWIFKPLIVEPTEDRFFFLMRSKLRLECCRKRKLKTFFVAKERSPLVVGHVCCFSPRLSTLPRVGWNAGFYFSRSEELGWKKGGGDGTGSRLPCLLLPPLCSNPWFLQTQIQRQHNTKNKDMASGWVRYRLQTVELVADTVIFCKNTKEKVNAHFTRFSWPVGAARSFANTQRHKYKRKDRFGRLWGCIIQTAGVVRSAGRWMNSPWTPRRQVARFFQIQNKTIQIQIQKIHNIRPRQGLT